MISTVPAVCGKFRFSWRKMYNVCGDVFDNKLKRMVSIEFPCTWVTLKYERNLGWGSKTSLLRGPVWRRGHNRTMVDGCLSIDWSNRRGGGGGHFLVRNHLWTVNSSWFLAPRRIRINADFPRLEEVRKREIREEFVVLMVSSGLEKGKFEANLWREETLCLFSIS